MCCWPVTDPAADGQDHAVPAAVVHPPERGLTASRPACVLRANRSSAITFLGDVARLTTEGWPILTRRRRPA